MKHQETAAVATFKDQVVRMAEYLQAAGYDVKHTHLVEASARFNGAKNWRTLRAELSTKQPAVKTVAPDLKGKTIEVYFETKALDDYGDGPMFCSITLGQAEVNRMAELNNLCEGNGLSEIHEQLFDIEWNDNEEYRMRNDKVVVATGDFWLKGRPKHADYCVESTMCGIESFFKIAVSALENGLDEIFCFENFDQIPDVMEQLGRDESDANYVTQEQAEERFFQ